MNFFSTRTDSAVGIIDKQTVFATTTIERFLHIIGCHTTTQASDFISATECDPYSCQQFIEVEGLGQIVIRSLVERSNLHGFFISCRKDNYRSTTPFAETAQECQAVECREREVEQDKLWLKNSRLVDGLCPVAYRLHYETPGSQLGQ